MSDVPDPRQLLAPYFLSYTCTGLFAQLFGSCSPSALKVSDSTIKVRTFLLSGVRVRSKTQPLCWEELNRDDLDQGMVQALPDTLSLFSNCVCKPSPGVLWITINVHLCEWRENILSSYILYTISKYYFIFGFSGDPLVSMETCLDFSLNPRNAFYTVIFLQYCMHYFNFFVAVHNIIHKTS